MIDDEDLRQMRKDAKTGATLSDFETLSLLDELETMRARNARLRKSLNWFLNDERFQVGVGGNPNVVRKMIADARAALDDAPEA